MPRFPRSLLSYVVVSTIYAALVFIGVQVVYTVELGRAGLTVAARDTGDILASIQSVSFIVWLGISLIAASVLVRLSTALAGARTGEERREQELGSIFGLSSALAGPVELEKIAHRFLDAVRRSLAPEVTAAVIVHDDVVEAFRCIAADGPAASDFLSAMYSASALPPIVRTRVIDHRQACVLADTSAAVQGWPIPDAEPRALARARSFAALPLVSSDRLVGALLLRADRTGALDANSLQVPMILGQYVAGAILSAFQLREAERRADREAVVNRVAQRARASLDPEQVLRATVEELGRALGVSRVAAALGGTPEDLRVAYEWSDADAAPTTASVAGTSAARLVARLGRTLVVPDVLGDPMLLEQIAREDLGRAGFRALLVAPIALGSQLTGVLALQQADRPRDWTSDEVRLVEAVARELRVAMESARVYQARRQESERLLALHRASAVLAAQTDPRVILEEILKNAVGLLGGGSASLFRWDAPAGLLRCIQNWQVANEKVSATLRPGEGVGGSAFERMAPVIVNDYARWEHATEVSKAAGQVAAIAVPLARSGVALGAIVIRSFEAGVNYTNEDAHLLALFGDQAVAALTASEAFEQQRRAMEELERLNKAKSDFVSIVSHEFRTPLTGIQGFSEMMRDEDLTGDEVREYAGDINKDAQRLNRMISEMLDLDRMESGRMTLNREDVDLNALIAEAADHVRPTAPNQPITLKLDPDVPRVSCDRDKLTQVLRNLLSNAVKYSPNGGDIVITTRLEGQWIHAVVRDHGMGIPDEALETVFERYRRVESHATRFIQGTGLGLPICRQILQLHGGRIWAESVVGEGSYFHFTLPTAAVATGVES